MVDTEWKYLKSSNTLNHFLHENILKYFDFELDTWQKKFLIQSFLYIHFIVFCKLFFCSQHVPILFAFLLISLVQLPLSFMCYSRKSGSCLVFQKQTPWLKPLLCNISISNYTLLLNDIHNIRIYQMQETVIYFDFTLRMIVFR